MKFRTQFSKNQSIAIRQCSAPCEQFSPGQGKTIAQVISDYVKGIPTESINYNGIDDPKRAEDALQVKTSRQLPIDESYLTHRIQTHVKELESTLSEEHLKLAKDNS